MASPLLKWTWRWIFQISLHHQIRFIIWNFAIWNGNTIPKSLKLLSLLLLLFSYCFFFLNHAQTHKNSWHISKTQFDSLCITDPHCMHDLERTSSASGSRWQMMVSRWSEGRDWRYWRSTSARKNSPTPRRTMLGLYEKSKDTRPNANPPNRKWDLIGELLRDNDG